jgi:TPR repeat protein
MKASLLSIVAASMIFGPALFAQTKPTIHRPPALTQPVPTPAPEINLNGIWQTTLGTRGTPSYQIVKMQITQTGSAIAIAQVQSGTPRDGVTAYQGHYANRAVSGQSLAALPQRGKPAQWIAEDITIVDPDHLAFSKGLSLARSAPQPNDVPCDSQDTYGVKPNYANERGKLAFQANNDPAAFCWMHASAIQGNAGAQDLVARMLRDGIGAAKNYPAAFSWAQKSAEQGYASGEETLADMYNRGLGTPRDPVRAKQLLAQANAQEAAKPHTEKPNANPQNSSQPSQRDVPQAAPNGMTPEQQQAIQILVSILDAEDSHPRSGAKLPNAADYYDLSNQDHVRQFEADCRDAGGHIGDGGKPSLGFVTFISCDPGAF